MSDAMIARAPRARLNRTRAGAGVAALVLGISLLCVTAGTSAAALRRGGTTGVRQLGSVDVAFAGSLELIDNNLVGPAFEKATGYGYTGRGAGSLALSEEIRSGEIAPDVFESVGAAPIVALEPRYARWYAQIASSPIVVAYNPHSQFAPVLRAIAHGRLPLRDLFTVMARPQFLLGRTDPNIDPQGAAFIEMVELAQRELGLAKNTLEAVLHGARPSSGASTQIFDETALEPRLQAGQLDAASAFLPQAIELHLPYIRLPTSIDLGDSRLARRYASAAFRLSDGTVVHATPLTIDLTVLSKGAQAPGGAFAAYAIGPAVRAMLRREGYSVGSVELVGSPRSAPEVVRRALGRS